MNKFKQVPALVALPWERLHKAAMDKVTIRDIGKGDELYDGAGDGDNDDPIDALANQMGWSTQGWWTYVTAYLQKVPWR